MTLQEQSKIKAISTKKVEEFFTKEQLEMIEDALEKAQAIPMMVQIVSTNNYDLLETSDPKRKLINNYRQTALALQKISRMITQLEDDE